MEIKEQREWGRSYEYDSIGGENADWDGVNWVRKVQSLVNNQWERHKNNVIVTANFIIYVSYYSD